MLIIVAVAALFHQPCIGTTLPCNMWRQYKHISYVDWAGGKSGNYTEFVSKPLYVCEGIKQNNPALSASHMFYCNEDELWMRSWNHSHNCSDGYIYMDSLFVDVDIRSLPNYWSYYWYFFPSFGDSDEYELEYECNKKLCDYAVATSYYESDFEPLCSSHSGSLDPTPNKPIIVRTAHVLDICAYCPLWDAGAWLYSCNATHIQFEIGFDDNNINQCFFSSTFFSSTSRTYPVGSTQCIFDNTELVNFGVYKGEIECYFNESAGTFQPTQGPTYPTTSPIGTPTILPIGTPTVSPTPKCDDIPFECSDGTLITKYYSVEQGKCVWPDGCHSDPDLSAHLLPAMPIICSSIFAILIA